MIQHLLQLHLSMIGKLDRNIVIQSKSDQFWECSICIAVPISGNLIFDDFQHLCRVCLVEVGRQEVGAETETIEYHSNSQDRSARYILDVPRLSCWLAVLPPAEQPQPQSPSWLHKPLIVTNKPDLHHHQSLSLTAA